MSSGENLARFPTRSFGLNLPIGEGQDDFPALLEHLASSLRVKNVEDHEIVAIILTSNEFNEFGWVPGFVVTLLDYPQSQRENVLGAS